MWTLQQLEAEKEAEVDGDQELPFKTLSFIPPFFQLQMRIYGLNCPFMLVKGKNV